MLPITFYLGQFTRLPLPPSGNLLTGKTVIITGANSGIGFETAHQLAALNPSRMILACRSLSSGREALDAVLSRAPRIQADVWELDLGDWKSVKAFADRAGEELGKVDLLINNAGLSLGSKISAMNKTEDGHEYVLQVNVLSPLLLTLLLHPLLARSDSPRIIFTTSEVHAWADPSLIARATGTGSILTTMNDEKTFVNPKRYTQSKLLLQMIIRRLIPAMPGFTIVSVNPGLCATRLARRRQFQWDYANVSQLIWNKLVSRTSEQGARNVTTAAILAKDSPEYWTGCEPGASPSTFLGKGVGMKATQQFWVETLGELERVAPGCTQGLRY